MSLGKRTPQQQEMWIATEDLPRFPGHIFYRKLNVLLSKVNFDHEVEALCKPYYAEHRGHPSIPPGVYFRTLLIDFFEGIGSQRGIAWRCMFATRRLCFCPLRFHLRELSTKNNVKMHIANRRVGSPLPTHSMFYPQPQQLWSSSLSPRISDGPVQTHMSLLTES